MKSVILQKQCKDIYLFLYNKLKIEMTSLEVDCRHTQDKRFSSLFQ